MDKFKVYHSIRSIQPVAAQYPAGKETARELAELASQLSSRTYRVAVIGEFKRGKSSLVNCILGTEVLPTDILPTTAVVNRIVYGTEQKVEIFYKDGTAQTTTVTELSDYATKKDEKRAGRIREIVVHYPSVFCQNNVELIDTPGLNDDEFMDKTTLDVLDKIDTAIVATHASYPVSETEKKLICRLIEQEDIYHLTFVATFIDRVSDETEEQDRVIDLIRERLSRETWQMFSQKHPNEPELLKKAERILCNPVVFAVSSRLAMQGFVSGNKKMLDESRFPHFKYELSALLTANQELDLLMKAIRLIRAAIENYDSWHESLLNELRAGLEREKGRLQTAQTCQKTGCEGLVDKLVQADRELVADGVIYSGTNEYKKSVLFSLVSKTVLRHLMEVWDGSREQAMEAPEKAAAEVDRKLREGLVEKRVYRRMDAANEHLLAAHHWAYGWTENELKDKLRQWRENTPFPQLKDVEGICSNMFHPAAAADHLSQDDIAALAAWVQERVLRQYEVFDRYQEELKAYIASWRSLLLKQNLADKEKMSEIMEKSALNIRQMRQQIDAAADHYDANLQVLTETERELSRMLQT